MAAPATHLHRVRGACQQFAAAKGKEEVKGGGGGREGRKSYITANIVIMNGLSL